MNREKIGFSCGAFLAVSIALSMVHPWGNPRSAVESNAQFLQGSDIPENVRQVLQKKCADCHSENTHYPPYARFAPVSWMIDHDIHDARRVLNLSRWQYYTADTQAELLTRIASEARSGQMLLKQYLLLHPGNRLTTEEQQQLYDWAKAERRRIRQPLSGNPKKPAVDSRTERQ